MRKMTVQMTLSELGDKGGAKLNDDMKVLRLLCSSMTPEAMTGMLDRMQGQVGMLSFLELIDDEQYKYYALEIENMR